jgi:hypothetical protein
MEALAGAATLPGSTNIATDCRVQRTMCGAMNAMRRGTNAYSMY